jgi:hypothetical protein
MGSGRQPIKNRMRILMIATDFLDLSSVLFMAVNLNTKPKI